MNSFYFWAKTYFFQRYERRRKIEEENIFIRKLQIQQELQKQANNLGKTKEGEIENNIYERSQQFYKLKEELAFYVHYLKKKELMFMIGRRNQKTSF